MSTTTLLDTPKRISLQQQSKELRQALKEYEHAFAAEHSGHKPEKKDIKENATIALKYSQYNKIRGVLDGYDRTPKRRKSPDNYKPTSTQGNNCNITATTPSRRGQLLNVTAELTDSSSPHRAFLTAIGPTPHRDGRILGLFDVMSNSPHSDATAAASLSRKRKVDEDTDTAFAHQTPLKTPRTSNRRLSRDEECPLRHNGSLLAESDTTGRVKHSRTPQSGGRKFALNLMLASPTTIRYFSSPRGSRPTNETGKQTPLRDNVLGSTPKRQLVSAGQETTPTYLKRSTSFKDRLLSATLDNEPTRKSSNSSGPMKLKHFRSAATNVRRSVAGASSIESDEENYNEDLEALREAEALHDEVFVVDSQNVATPLSTLDEKNSGKYKKKGQKRTTRKSNIRPSAIIKSTEPNFVSASTNHEDEFSDDHENVKESQPLDFLCIDEGDVDLSKRGDLTGLPKSAHKERPESASTKKAAQLDKSAQKGQIKHKSATINPNAISHMNFRTLKIKNKNSKGKGKGRFGKGRR